MEFFLLDDKNVFLKNKKLLNKNIFKIVDEVSSSESNVRKTRGRVAKISSFPTPMVHQKIIISSTKETDNCEAKSSYQLRHKKQSKPEEKKSESHLQGDIQDKSRNEIGIDIFWHAFFYSGLFGLSLYWLLWVTLLIFLRLFLDYTVFNISTNTGIEINFLTTSKTLLVVLKVTSKMQCYLIFKKHFFWGGRGVTTNKITEPPKMERTVSVGATNITCNNPCFTFYYMYMIILFPINC